jgi:hypothetical protein
VRDCTPDRVAEVCGLRKQDLFTAAQWFAQSPATLSLYCQGLNQSSSGTAKNATLINLHLATGQIGKPGAGPFSLTGQPNAMGGREVGGLANLLSAHRDLANPAHRAEVAALWGLPSVPDKPGKTAVEMFQAAADGEIKALWIACTNPAQSMPDQATVRRALQRAEFVVVQEAFATATTCDFADLLLPATTWGEKEGTVTNSERRISRVRAAVPAPGEARHDWQIVVDFAQRLERRLTVRAERVEALASPSTEPVLSLSKGSGRAVSALFPYTTPESIWLEHRESTRGRDLDITGLSYALLEQQGPQQWPMPEGAKQGQQRLYENGVFPTADGKARFAALAWQPLAEPRESRFPFSLTTGRLRDQWHGMSRTGTLGRLFGHVAEPVVQLNPQDMQRRGFKEGELVHVTSKRGSIVVPVQGSSAIGLSQAFMAMHWGPEYLSGRSSAGDALAGVNALTTSAHCATSKQPELKHAAVKVLKAELPWTCWPWPGCRRTGPCRSRPSCARSCPVSTSPPACPSAANAPACCSGPPPRKRPTPPCWTASKPCWACNSPTPCATWTNAWASAARRGWSRPPKASAWRVSCWRATPAPKCGSPAAAGRTSGRVLRPTPAHARRQGAGGAGRPQPAGVHLLQRERGRYSQAPGDLRRCSPSSACASAARPPALRHQLRLLHSRAAPSGARHAPAVAGRLTPRFTAQSAYNPKSSELPDNRAPWASASTSRKSVAARTAPALSREQATDLMGQVLDGTVTDLEVGGFCLAMRIKGETPEEMAGFLDATHQRLHRLPDNGHRHRGAAQLQRCAQAAGAHPPAGPAAGERNGAAVLVHGTATEDRRVTSAAVFAALGVPGVAAGAL